MFDSVGILVELLELVEEVVPMADLEDLWRCSDSLHRVLEDDVKVCKLLDFVRKLLVDFRPAEDAIQVQPIALEDGEVD